MTCGIMLTYKLMNLEINAMNQTKTGLVLEGGAMRGMFTAGVTDVMMENGIAFAGAVGVSAGAAFGCNYKSNQPGRAIRYNLRFCRDPRYCSLRSLIRTGDLYGAEFCYHVLPDTLDLFDAETYNRSPMEFYAVCTDVVSGEAVYHNCSKADEDIFEWIRASASMPLVSRIVEVGGYRMLDGGMADPIPLRFFERIGYDRNVVILTQPKEYVKQKNRQLPLIRAAYRKYPALAETIARRHEVYNETTAYIREQEARGNVFVIRPPAPLNIGAVEHDPQRLQEVYRVGRCEGEKSLAGLRAFLGE